MVARKRRFWLVFFAIAIVFANFIALLPASKATAAGEIYTWINPTTMQVSGGVFSQPTNITGGWLDGNSNNNSYQNYQLSGKVPTKTGGCDYLLINISVTNSAATQGTVSGQSFSNGASGCSSTVIAPSSSPEAIKFQNPQNAPKFGSTSVGAPTPGQYAWANTSTVTGSNKPFSGNVSISGSPATQQQVQSERASGVTVIFWSGSALASLPSGCRAYVEVDVVSVDASQALIGFYGSGNTKFPAVGNECTAAYIASTTGFTSNTTGELPVTITNTQNAPKLNAYLPPLTAPSGSGRLNVYVDTGLPPGYNTQTGTDQIPDGVPQQNTVLLCDSGATFNPSGTSVWNEPDWKQVDSNCLQQVSGAVTDSRDLNWALGQPPSGYNLPPGAGSTDTGGGYNTSGINGWYGFFSNVKAGYYDVCETDTKTCNHVDLGWNISQYCSAGTDNNSGANPACNNTQPGQWIVVPVVHVKSPTTSYLLANSKNFNNTNDEPVCTTGNNDLSASLAWILCPIVELIAKATDFVQNTIIVPFLTVSPLTTQVVTSDGKTVENPIYTMWKAGRDLANIFAVGIFLFILYSQATSFGLSRYGIKALMLRFVGCLVLANISYFVVAFTIDAFNIFGAGISHFITAVLINSGIFNQEGATSAGAGQSIFVLGGGAIVAVLASGGAAIGWFASFMMIFFLILIVAVIVLLVRQLVILLFAAFSAPIAMAKVLPGTEPFFDKPVDAFQEMMLMQPLIIGAFGLGHILGAFLDSAQFTFASGSGTAAAVSDAARVFAAALARGIALVLLPIIMASRHAILARTHRFATQLGNRGRENVQERAGLYAGMAASRIARSNIPVASSVAGRNARRRAMQQRRRTELDLAQQSYVNDVMSSDTRSGRRLRRQAAGVGGQGAQARIRASADEAQYEEGLKQVKAYQKVTGLSDKEFSNGLKNHLQGKSSVVRGALGEYNFADHPELMRASLSLAASQGEVTALEAARMAPPSVVEQTVVDDAIARNEGTMKGKGGFHLATNSNLAYGRSLSTTPAIAQQQMAAARLDAFSQSSSNDISGMKAGLVEEVARSLAAKDPITGQPQVDPATGKLVPGGSGAVYNLLTANLNEQVSNAMQQAVQNDPTLSSNPARYATEEARQRSALQQTARNKAAAVTRNINTILNNPTNSAKANDKFDSLEAIRDSV